MLFRNFILVTIFIALAGVGLLQVLTATNPNHSDFKVGKRLKEWQLHDARKACQADPRLCFVRTDGAGSA